MRIFTYITQADEGRSLCIRQSRSVAQFSVQAIGCWQVGMRGTSMSWMRIALLVFEGVMGLFMAYAAYSLFSGTPPSVAASRKALRYPRWYWALAGVVATIAAITLLAGLYLPIIGAFGALWCIAYFIVATFTHLFRADFKNLGLPMFFALVFLGLAALQWGEVMRLITYAHLL